MSTAMVKIIDAPITRVLFVSTHVSQTTGYARVTFNLLKQLGLRDDVEIVHYGFQNFNQSDPDGKQVKGLPESVIVHDAARAEVPFEAGFGIAQFRSFAKLARPDVILIYNDAQIIGRFLMELNKEPQVCANARVIIYLDQVYFWQRPEFLAIVQRYADHVICFTEGWKQELLKQGFSKPVSTVMHGFDPKQFFPIDMPPRPEGSPMVIININRNQPRKRYDLFAITVARLFAKRPDANIKFVVSAELKTGAWDVPAILERELRKSFNDEEAAKYMGRLLSVSKPGTLSNDDINRIYSEGDVGFSMASGKGVGLCQFEHSGIGRPQICGDIGGFKEYLDSDSAILLPVVGERYCESTSGIGGIESELSPDDAVDAILKYYDSPELRQKHGQRARAKVLSYDWPSIADQLHQILTA
jgi:glycosyltransferase involved in cell wall biosynthesis